MRTRARTDSYTRETSLGVGLSILLPLALLGNALGVLIPYPELGASVMYLPYAALVAVLVASPKRHWGWYILASIAAHVVVNSIRWPVTWIVVTNVANTARALVATLLLRRFFRGVPAVDSVAALGMFITSTVLIAPMVGATIGASNALLHDIPQTYPRLWLGWFVSSALTGLTVLPALVLAMSTSPIWMRTRFWRRRGVEIALLSGAVLGTSALAFHVTFSGDWAMGLMFYAPVAPLLWAALRLGPAGASIALSVVALVAMSGAARHSGAFLATTPANSLISLQFFLVLTALPVLGIAAIDRARHGAVQLYRSVLGSFQDHVAILDARGVVLVVNESWRRFADDAHECPLDRLRVGDDAFAACRVALASKRKAGDADGERFVARVQVALESVLNGHRRAVDMDYDREQRGQREWFTLRVEAREHSEGGVVMTRANVSARRRTQIELEQQRKALAHLARVGMLGQLSGALAHELRQPLSAILANAEAARLMLRRGGTDQSLIIETLDEIVAQDRRAATVIDGLRAMLKQGETRLQPVDTMLLLREVLDLAHAELVTRGVTATVAVGAEVPPLLADRVQLQQVLLNLILNACEAMSAAPRGARTLTLSASVTSTGDVCLSVRDAGTGFPPDLSDRLFEPFVTTKPDGLGLGLSIARTIVAAHGGRIWAENHREGGATVHCILTASTGPLATFAPRETAAAVS